MTKKRKILLLIYAIIIILILVFILFIAPDSMFTEDTDIKLPETNTKEFIDYQEQQQHLILKNYNYEYDLLDSMSQKTYHFDCEGQKENGTCSLPEKLTYTEKNYQETFKNIDYNYLDPEFIFNLLKDIKPEETKYQSYREYTYNIKIKDLDTELVVTTDYDNINNILISNAYMTYILKFNNVKY